METQNVSQSSSSDQQLSAEKEQQQAAKEGSMHANVKQASSSATLPTSESRDDVQQLSTDTGSESLDDASMAVTTVCGENFDLNDEDVEFFSVGIDANKETDGFRMKTQNYGWGCVMREHDSFLLLENRHSSSQLSEQARNERLHPSSGHFVRNIVWLAIAALQDYRESRENGIEQDSPLASFPDGGLSQLQLISSSGGAVSKLRSDLELPFAPFSDGVKGAVRNLSGVRVNDYKKWPDKHGHYQLAIKLRGKGERGLSNWKGILTNKDFWWAKDEERGWPDKQHRYWFFIYHKSSNAKIGKFFHYLYCEKRKVNQNPRDWHFVEYVEDDEIAKWMKEKDERVRKRNQVEQRATASVSEEHQQSPEPISPSSDTPPSAADIEDIFHRRVQMLKEQAASKKPKIKFRNRAQTKEILTKKAEIKFRNRAQTKETLTKKADANADVNLPSMPEDIKLTSSSEHSDILLSPEKLRQRIVKLEAEINEPPPHSCSSADVEAREERITRLKKEKQRLESQLAAMSSPAQEEKQSKKEQEKEEDSQASSTPRIDKQSYLAQQEDIIKIRQAAAENQNHEDAREITLEELEEREIQQQTVLDELNKNEELKQRCENLEQKETELTKLQANQSFQDQDEIQALRAEVQDLKARFSPIEMQYLLKQEQEKLLQHITRNAILCSFYDAVFRHLNRLFLALEVASTQFFVLRDDVTQHLLTGGGVIAKQIVDLITSALELAESAFLAGVAIKACNKVSCYFNTKYRDFKICQGAAVLDASLVTNELLAREVAMLLTYEYQYTMTKPNWLQNSKARTTRQGAYALGVYAAGKIIKGMLDGKIPQELEDEYFVSAMLQLVFEEKLAEHTVMLEVGFVKERAKIPVKKQQIAGSSKKDTLCAESLLRKKTALVVLDKSAEGNAQLSCYVQQETDIDSEGQSIGTPKTLSKPKEYGFRWPTLRDLEAIKKPVEREVTRGILTRKKRNEWIPDPTLRQLPLKGSLSKEEEIMVHRLAELPPIPLIGNSVANQQRKKAEKDAKKSAKKDGKKKMAEKQGKKSKASSPKNSDTNEQRKSVVSDKNDSDDRREDNSNLRKERQGECDKPQPRCCSHTEPPQESKEKNANEVGLEALAQKFEDKLAALEAAFDKKVEEKDKQLVQKDSEIAAMKEQQKIAAEEMKTMIDAQDKRVQALEAQVAYLTEKIDKIDKAESNAADSNAQRMGRFGQFATTSANQQHSNKEADGDQREQISSSSTPI